MYQYTGRGVHRVRRTVNRTRVLYTCIYQGSYYTVGSRTFGIPDVCPAGRLVLPDVLSLRTFCPTDVMSPDVLSPDVLSLRTFYPSGRYVSGLFLSGPLYTCIYQGSYSTIGRYVFFIIILRVQEFRQWMTPMTVVDQLYLGLKCYYLTGAFAVSEVHIFLFH
jgi:hypothetical protein